MIATVANRAMTVVIVKTVVKKGEKVFNAYMMMSPFVSIVVGGGWERFAALFSLYSSVVNRNEWASPHRVMGAL